MATDKRQPFVKPVADPPKLTWGTITEQARIVRDLKELGGVVIDSRPDAGFVPRPRNG